MLPPDLQRIRHILDYCEEIQKTILRCGDTFEHFDQDADFQRSVSFSILQIGELSGGLSEEFRKATCDRVQWGPHEGYAQSGGTQLWQHEPPHHLGDRHRGYSRPQAILRRTAVWVFGIA